MAEGEAAPGAVPGATEVVIHTYPLVKVSLGTLNCRQGVLQNNIFPVITVS